MPMFHIYGTFLSFVHGLRVGAKLVSMSKFDPQKWLQLIQDHKAKSQAPAWKCFRKWLLFLESFVPKCFQEAESRFESIVVFLQATFLTIVPPIAVLLAKSPIVDQFDLSSIRILFCGAAPLGADTQKQVEARLKNAVVIQGELTTQVHTGFWVVLRATAKRLFAREVRFQFQINTGPVRQTHKRNFQVSAVQGER